MNYKKDLKLNWNLFKFNTKDRKKSKELLILFIKKAMIQVLLIDINITENKKQYPKVTLIKKNIKKYQIIKVNWYG